MRTTTAVLAAALALAPAMPAHAATPRVVGSAFDRYLPADQAIDRGDALTLVNLENSPHDVVSVNDATTAGGCSSPGWCARWATRRWWPASSRWSPGSTSSTARCTST